MWSIATVLAAIVSIGLYRMVKFRGNLHALYGAKSIGQVGETTGVSFGVPATLRVYQLAPSKNNPASVSVEIWANSRSSGPERTILMLTPEETTALQSLLNVANQS